MQMLGRTLPAHCSEPQLVTGWVGASRELIGRQSPAQRRPGALHTPHTYVCTPRCLSVRLPSKWEVTFLLRADLPLRSSMLLQVSSFSKCSNLASFQQYGNHLLRALSLPGSVPGGEFVSCHVAEFGFIH